MKRLFLFLTNIFLTAFLFSQSWYSGEYWFDRNYSQKVAFSCSNEMSDFNFNASALNPGFHTLNLHLNNSGVWCAPLSYGFYKIDSQFLNNTSSDVTYKCWFDRDYSSIQSGNISNGMIALPTENIEVGLHTLYIAIENAGKQSGLYSYAFYKIDSQFLNNTSSDVTYKCWFDRDYSSIQSGNIANGMIALPTENLEVGLHTLYIAIENAGKQSGVYSYAFYKFSNSDLENPNSVALSYSYWFDNDDAHKITGQLQNGLLMLDTDTLSVGDHYLNIQVNNVTPSHLYRVPFYKAPPTFVVSSLTDTLQGYVEGLGEFDSLSVVQISAVANPCYEFVSWNDGNTDNPREFTLTKDTVFTALFEEIEFDTELSATICEGQVYTDNGFNVSEAGVYTQNLQTENGCDSIVTLNLSVNPIYNTDLVASICDGEVYNENGFNVNEAGVYSQTLQALNGCDSIVTLTLSVNPILNTDLSAFICEGETYTENGFNVSEAGVYTQSLQSVNGCDSIVTLTLNVNPIFHTELSATICEGSAYNDNGFNVSEAGTYTQNLTTVNGCDSIVTLTLNINSVLYTSLTETICEGQTYTDNGFNVSEAGVYTQNLTSVNGCDSIVTLNLSVNPIYNTDLVASICDGEVYNENGFNVNEAGVYSQTLQALNGCDSIVTLTLSVNPIFNTDLSAFICEGQTYTENGFNVSEAGVYTQSLQSVNGCDSIVTLTLNVNPIFHTELSATICEGSAYNDNGFNVSEAGTYTQNLTTANGCDSIVTLTLNINSVLYTSLTETICEGQTYTDNGFNVSEAGVYTQNLTSVNGCDSIVTLNLSVNPIYNTDLVASICDGEVYNENGFNVNEAGVYSQTLQALNGCDSIVTLMLSVNPILNTNLSAFICEGQTYTENGFNVSEAGVYTQSLQSVNGCDSIVTLTLNVNPIFHTELSATICEGSVYNDNGFNVSEAGTYTQNLTTANGCDSIVTLTLNINSVLYTSLTETICQGQVYTDNGFNVSEAGVYTQNLTSVNGCDSIVTLNLSVNPIYNTDLVASICDGEVYNENGFNVNEAGVYSQTLQALNGCDSIVTLTLSVNPIFNTDLSAFICEGETYTENGFNVSEAGTYTQSLQSVNGCDSIVTLTLNVNPIFHTELSATICEGSAYNDNGFNVSEAGTYTQNLQSVNGCDSIVTLTLNVLPSYNTNLTATICEGSELNISGFNVSEAGVYTQTYTAVNGCDSIVTLTVTELPTIHTDLTLTICEGTSLNFSGFNVSEAGVYTQNLTSVNGCDSIVTLTVSVNPVFDTTINATINSGETYAEYGFNESESGTYVQNLQTVNGCDSTITLNLTVNSSLYDVAELTEITFYPNPTSGKVTFSKEIEKIEVIDNIGKIVMRFFDTNEINIEALPSGAYYLRMTIEDKTIMRKVIKE